MLETGVAKIGRGMILTTAAQAQNIGIGPN